MLRSRKLLPAVAALAVAVLLGTSYPAQAAFTLTFHEAGFADQTVTDVGGTGVISYNGSFGTFRIQGNFATSNSADGVQPAQLTIANTSISSTGGGTLTVTLADTGFTAPGTGSAFLDTQLSTTQLPANSTVTSHSAVNGTAGGNVQLTTVGGGLREDIANIGTNPYTLSNVTTFVLNSNGTVQFTGITTATAVPAPAGVVLALTGLPVLGLGWLRRRRKRA